MPERCLVFRQGCLAGGLPKGAAVHLNLTSKVSASPAADAWPKNVPVTVPGGGSSSRVGGCPAPPYRDVRSHAGERVGRDRMERLAIPKTWSFRLSHWRNRCHPRFEREAVPGFFLGPSVYCPGRIFRP
jgi:hypothetical protein